MRELSLVRLTEDGAALLLADGDDRFELPVDDRLVAAVRRDRLRMGQLQIELESTLRPAEIQARIRAGETAEHVAAAAGVPVERIRRYEGPVLAEREHFATVAQTTPVRRRDGSASDRPVPLLGELVERRLEDRGAPVDTLLWDSFRRDDGCWQVTCRDGSRDEALGSWVFDPRRHIVRAFDEAARRLTDPPAATPPGASPAPAETPAARGSARRLSSVPSRQANGPAGAHPPGREPAPDRTPDREPAREAQPDSAVTARVAADVASPSVAPASPAAAEPAEAAEQLVPAGEQAVPAAGPPVPAGGQPADDGQVGSDEDPAAAVPAAARTSTARGRRASVPSWDDIVFGARKRD